MRHTFSEVWVISLKRRSDRHARFLENIRAIDWPFQTPKMFAAIDGDKVGVPQHWQTGGGSYGCHRSHMLLLERAIQEDLESILIMEDDATFMADFGRRVQDFMGVVPNDWECLMLGGQHMNSIPVPVSRGVVRAGSGGGIQRTHCYALRGLDAMRELYKVWADSRVHCDWVMGPCLAKRNTYAPDPFLVGQAFGPSDISGSLNPAKFWKEPTRREPLIVLKAPRFVMEKLQEKGWHGGFTRDAVTGIDVGLLDALGGANTEAERNHKLRKWIEMIQWEVASMENAVACMWHPEASADMVSKMIRGQVMEINASSCEEAQMQFSLIFCDPSLKRVPVAILRTPREVMETLRDHGFHSGYTRDPATGEDVGVKQALMESQNHDQLSWRLTRIARLLDEEAMQRANGIATFWHPFVQKDHFCAEEFNVVEISASTEAEAILQRDLWIDKDPVSIGLGQDSHTMPSPNAKNLEPSL